MTDEDLKKEIFENKVYGQIIGTDLTIFDIGACSGWFSLYAQPHAKIIYAFEPFDKAIEKFKENTKDYKNIKLIEKAVSDVNGKVNLYENVYAGNSILDNGRKLYKKVDSVILYDFVKDNKIDNIDFLKIDVEGAEKNIFESKNFQGVLEITKVFVMENHYHNKSYEDILVKNNFKISTNSNILFGFKL